MLLYCVRHGQTTHNLQHRFQGQSDAARLTELGRRQATALAAAFRGLPIEAVYSSPLSRAWETAQPIAAALGIPLKRDRRLMEMDMGIFQDRLHAEMEAQHPAIMARWLAGELDFAIPLGESRRALMERGAAALQAIHSAGYKQAVVVTHGGLLRSAIWGLVPNPPELSPFSMANGSITQLEFKSDAVRIVHLNQTEHLDGLDTASGDL